MGGEPGLLGGEASPLPPPVDRTLTSQTSQHLRSEDVAPDYKLFQISEPDCNGFITATMIEVKTRNQFNDDGVYQTIGYHVASQASVHANREDEESNADPLLPLLAVLICEVKARLILFPFVKSVA